MDAEEHQEHKIEPLSKDATQVLHRYGALPRRKSLLEHQTRKYFDSGDFALSAAHRMADEGAIQTGTSHPIRDGIPHPFAPVPNASNVSRDANKDLLTQGKHPLSKMVQGHLRNQLDDGDVKAEDTGEFAARATIGED
ncbi:hypothetical protein BDV38DRAFT_252239 [Aspergillus pseudotamarii]|uniref:mRNA stability protein n=1 Tax=Aspergillus pseudotamarii TaxID=132259 RepID=A0A5N6SLJ3_ASPPS|nr:uncharacterized protein BDV38DRAFT_252239 [Aspergillus pseudotamarii]KAE8135578.1 hypothetical protein BDV38DRAFT_252239 [Aspergillus pseudotamarii]